MTAKFFVLFGAHASYGEPRGYHVYQRIWDAAIGEVLDCDREPDNAVDHYAVKLSSCLFNHSYLFVDTTNGGSAQRLRQAPFWVRKLTCYELARTSKSTFSTTCLFLETKFFREYYFSGSRSPANTAKISCSRNFPVLR